MEGNEGKTELRTVVRVPFTAELADGVWTQMRGRREYLIAPLNFKALKQLRNDVATIEGMRGVPTIEQMDVVVRTVHSSMKWNYPEITTDEVEELVDLANFLPTWKAMIGASGLSPRAAGEAPPGETQAAS